MTTGRWVVLIAIALAVTAAGSYTIEYFAPRKPATVGEVSFMHECMVKQDYSTCLRNMQHL